MTVTRRRNAASSNTINKNGRKAHQQHQQQQQQESYQATPYMQMNRPDKHPWSMETMGSLFHHSPAFPLRPPHHRYPVVVGQSFWQLSCALDQLSIPVRRRQNKAGLLIRGYRGCGKSYLLAAAVQLLPSHPHEQLEGVSRWTCCLIPDCAAWQQNGGEQLEYLRLELLTGLGRMIAGNHTGSEEELLNSASFHDHRAPDHYGCIQCVEPFTRLEQVCSFLRKKQEQHLHMVFLLDQAEAFLQHGMTHQTMALIQTMMQVGTVIVSVREEDWLLSDDVHPFKQLLESFTCLRMPSRMTVTEMGRLLEILPSLDSDDLDDMVDDSGGLLREVRWWTGAQASQLDLMFSLELSTSSESSSHSWQRRFEAYEGEWVKRIEVMMEEAGTLLDGPTRNTLLIGLFAMALRVPLDWTDRYQVGQLETCLRRLGHSWLPLIRTDCLTTFYHPTEGTVCLLNIPTAPAHATHLALLHPKILARIAPTWESLFNTVTQAMLASAQVCGEAKRRLVRSYLHARLYWYQQGQSEKLNWSTITGEMADTGDTIQIQLHDPLVVPFAGVLPAWWRMDLIMSARNREQPVVFVPVSPRHWFFDLMIWLPTDKRLLAITTTPLVGTWIKEGIAATATSSATATSNTTSTTTTTTSMKQLQTPTVTMEAWREALRAAGLTRIGPVRCVVCKATDLMQAAGVKLSQQ